MKRNFLNGKSGPGDTRVKNSGLEHQQPGEKEQQESEVEHAFYQNGRQRTGKGELFSIYLLADYFVCLFDIFSDLFDQVIGGLEFYFIAYAAEENDFYFLPV